MSEPKKRMPEEKSDLIKKLIKEIEQALDEELFIIALNATLTLPDICGNAEYPDKKAGFRYKEWIRNFIEANDYTKHRGTEITIINAEMIYELRCALLHQGNPNIHKNEVVYFELVKSSPQKASTTAYHCEMEVVTEDGKEMLKKKKISLDIREFCRLICNCAMKYYLENKEKFDFFNYNLVDVNFHTAQTFHIRQNIF